MVFSDFKQAASAVNEAWRDGKAVTVNGREVLSWNRHMAPAVVWGTGSLSVRVKAKAKGKVNEAWFKPGVSVVVNVTFR